MLLCSIPASRSLAVVVARRLPFLSAKKVLGFEALAELFGGQCHIGVMYFEVESTTLK